ncbi:hypothetical protein J1G35_04605 [Pseudomonas sp. SH10-3B]|jgi:hypothetical protein|uniref:YopT-type cysteine protease domain-containing protein n=1 Tax=Pseudomonas sp. SH10-3B TaxID=2816049 RepID=UPI001CA6704B|nr:YopT-type cysteine protease domain-containing protein [Pseudomonas sp. SH10-3B]MBY8945131.1 hypothetical protein [Pseudomonas sp. SH10-3B]
MIDDWFSGPFFVRIMTVGLERWNKPVSMARKAGKLRVVTGNVNMKERLLNLCKKYDVEIVKYYKQSNDPALRSYDLTRGGWCFGMTIDWLRCKRKNIDFWGSLNSDSGKSRVRFLMARQEMVLLKGTFADTKPQVQAGMSSAGLVLRTLELCAGINDQVCATALVDSLLRGEGRYRYFSIHDGLGTAHAMGFLRSQTQLVFMDPNAGEFVFPKESVFGLWLLEYLKLMRYESKGLLRTYLVQSFG